VPAAITARRFNHRSIEEARETAEEHVVLDADRQGPTGSSTPPICAPR